MYYEATGFEVTDNRASYIVWGDPDPDSDTDSDPEVSQGQPGRPCPCWTIEVQQVAHTKQRRGLFMKHVSNS